MTAREIVESVRRRDIAADEAQLYGALKRLEAEICIYGQLPEKEFSEDGEMYAPEAFRNMYEEYLRSENALLSEDWDCYERHEALFRTERERLREYLVKNMPERVQKFSIGEGWL